LVPAALVALFGVLDATLPPVAPAAADGGQAQGAPADPRSRRGLLPVAAAIVPGLVIHGSGHYVAGDTEGARRLLATQSVGLALFVAGVGGLSLSGASRRMVVPFELAAIGGVGLMALTAMAGIYGVTARHGGLGGEDPLVPAWQLGLGALYVRNPTFPYRWLTGAEVEAWLQRMRFGALAFSTLDGETLRAGAQGAYRLRGPRPHGAGQPFDRGIVDLGGGVLHHRERRGPGPFDITTFDLTVGGRFGLGWYMRTLAGSFVEWAAGASVGAYHYGGLASTTEYNDALLLRFGYGFYLGRQTAPRGELLFVYDHHHDDFAGGLKLPGLGSGPAGHIGVEAVGFFSDRWGLAARALFGSAHLYGLALRWRPAGDP
jgi:hypothetical protein